MMKIVVADDEYFARKVLVKMLEESGLELEMAGEAETGIEVLDILEREQIDIVITDIRMPDMDGLQLSERINREYPEVKVIIESGYADFNYAASAIRYGVKNYLTKPVNKDELAETVNRIVEERRKYQRMIEQKLAAQKVQYMDFAHLLEKPELGSLILKRAAEKTGQGNWRLCVGQSELPKLSEQQIEEVLDILESPVGKLKAEGYYFGAKSEFILILSGETESEAFLETAVKKKAEACRGERIPLTAGISREQTASTNFLKVLSGAYREAVYALNQRLLQPGKGIYLYEDEVNPKELFGRDNEKLLEQCLGNHDTEKGVWIVEEFFRKCVENQGMTIYSLFASLIQIMNVINRVYSAQIKEQETEQEKGSYLMFSFKTDLYSFHSIEELKKYMVQLIEDVTEQDAPKSSMIGELLRYLERNYQYDISVNELAEHKYFVSPSYLSRLFKAETGKNFSKYLTELRMEKARSLLLETTLKVSDIAAFVGYNDVSYFIQTFKKQNQMTPEQYRGKGC